MNQEVFSDPIHILGESALNYCPTDEWIFPSIISTAPFKKSALGKWYMYYSPHDAPGGICLAYANDLAGPWTEYPGNPMIANKWHPHYSVSHVASPHALWIPEYNKLFLWFHGENNITRYASSADGINFHYEGVAASQLDKPELMEMSYSRVFRNPNTEKPDDSYIMLFMGKPDDRRNIYVGRSPDARKWILDESPLVIPPLEFGQNTSGPWLWSDNDRLYVLHHIDRFVGDPANFDLAGSIYITEVSPDLRRAFGTKLFYKSRPGYPDYNRVADIQLIESDNRRWMFYIGGRRLQGRIYARTLDRMEME